MAVRSLRKVDTEWRGTSSGAATRNRVAPAESPASRSSGGLRGSVVSDITLLWHGILLSGVAGFVDAAGFVLLLGIFPAHLTGELVSDAIAVSSGQLAARASRLWFFPTFMLSIAVAALVARVLRQRGHKPLMGLLALVTASLALFTGCDLCARLFHQAHLPFVVTGSCAVAAMGFQTALMRESLTGSCPTTVMTGNLAQVIMELVDQLFSLITASRLRDPPRSRLTGIGSALLAFAGCAVLGGFLTRHFGSLSAALPTVVTAALTVRAFREDQKPRPSLEKHALPWLSDDEIWPDSSAPQALSPPYTTESSSGTQLKAEPVAPTSEAPPHTRNTQNPARRSVSGTRLAIRPPKDD